MASFTKKTILRSLVMILAKASCSQPQLIKTKSTLRWVQKQLLPILTSIKKVNDRILIATFRGNPKTVIISCYSPHNHVPIDEVEAFYEQLSNVISTIPPHNNLIIGGDFNARITGKFSYHQLANRNGELMEEFLHQHHLLAGNTLLQKRERKLWTWRHPAGHLAQIDFILYRKR